MYRKFKSCKKLFRQLFEDLNPKIIRNSMQIIDFLRDWKSFNQNNKNDEHEVSSNNFEPCLLDKTETTELDAVYFHQNAWAFGKIMCAKPKHHVDVGSQVPAVGLMSEIVPVTFVDIRPIEVLRPNMKFVEGTILELPFEDKSIESLSSICVIEHIGLGRYGDPIDSFGTEKAARELIRVLKDNGDLYISVPVSATSKIYFNAHRSFNPEYIKKLFNELSLIEEQYIYGKEVEKVFNSSHEGVGLYHFKKT